MDPREEHSRQKGWLVQRPPGRDKLGVCELQKEICLRERAI